MTAVGSDATPVGRRVRGSAGPRAGHVAGGPEAMSVVVAVLVPVVVAELAILRLFTRTAIHIPALEFLGSTYRTGATIGRFTYHVAAVLLIAALVALGVELAGADTRQFRSAATAVGVFGATAVAARVGLIDDVTTALVTMTCVAVLAAGAAAGRGRAGLAFGLFGTAFVTAGAFTVVQQVATAGGPDIDARWLLTASELLALGAAVCAPLIVATRPSRRELVVGGVSGLVVAGALMGNGSTVKILTLWNFGLAGRFPGIVYGLACAGVVGAVMAAYRQQWRLTAAGLVLIFVGAVGLRSTYQSGLVVAGLALVIYARSVGERVIPTEGVAR